MQRPKIYRRSENICFVVYYRLNVVGSSPLRSGRRYPELLLVRQSAASRHPLSSPYLLAVVWWLAVARDR